MAPKKNIHRGNILCWMFILWISLPSNSILAQDFLYHSKNITVDVNRSHKDVHCVLQDDHGYFWAATWNGLYRFDGFNTEHIQIMPGDAPIRIEDMMLRNGLLYLGTERGLKCLRISDRVLLPMPGIPETDTVIKIRADDHGRLWWLSHNGRVSRYDHGKLNSIHISTYSSSVFGSLEIAYGSVWISSYDKKLFRIDPESVRISSSIFTPEDAYINSMMVNPDGELMLLCNDVVYRLIVSDDGRTSMEPRPEYGGKVTQLIDTHLGTFIVRERSRIGHLYRKDDKYVYNEIPWTQEKPENTNRIKLFGDILLVSYRSGILMVNISRNKFDPFHITYRPEINRIETARGIEEDDKNIYLATYDAIYVVDKATGRERELVRKKYLFRDLLLQGDTLWFASEGGGFFRMNSKTGQITSAGINSKHRQKILICVSPLGKDRLIVGGYEGYSIYDKHLDKMIDVEPAKVEQRINHRLVFQTEAINDHQFIIASQAGLFLLDDRGNLIRKYGDSVIGENGMEVLCFWRAPDQTIWAGTTNGLFHVDATGKVLKHLTREEGLAGDIVATLTPDGMGRLWAATYNGLSCVRLADLNIRNFRKEDGLPDNEFNQASNRITNDGKILLGTMNGFIRIDPTSFPYDISRSLKIQVSSIEKGDQISKQTSFGLDSISSQEIRIGKGVNYAKISFALLPIGLNSNAIFEYRIRGVHQDWIRMRQDPTIVIDNFRKGEYVLEVRCITGLGSKEIATLEIPLVVEEYFFRETWFYVLMITLLLSVLILFLYSQLQKKKRIEEIRHELSQNLHDEMGTYLTTIGMNADMLSAKLPENRHVESIRKMSRHAMDFIKDNLWTLDSSSDNALQLWDRTKAFTSESCEGLDIRCEFNEIPGLEHVKLSMKQKNNLLLIAKELVNNAIKHGDRKLIRLEWINDAAGHRMLMTNHIGTDKAEGSGTGLVNVSRRIEELGGTMTGIQQEDQFFVTVWMKFIK
jgi:ligand-binding sensor domain-containing protein